MSPDAAPIVVHSARCASAATSRTSVGVRCTGRPSRSTSPRDRVNDDAPGFDRWLRQPRRGIFRRGPSAGGEDGWSKGLVEPRQRFTRQHDACNPYTSPADARAAWSRECPHPPKHIPLGTPLLNGPASNLSFQGGPGSSVRRQARVPWSLLLRVFCSRRLAALGLLCAAFAAGSLIRHDWTCSL